MPNSSIVLKNRLLHMSGENRFYIQSTVQAGRMKYKIFPIAVQQEIVPRNNVAINFIQALIGNLKSIYKTQTSLYLPKDPLFSHTFNATILLALALLLRLLMFFLFRLSVLKAVVMKKLVQKTCLVIVTIITIISDTTHALLQQEIHINNVETIIEKSVALGGLSFHENNIYKVEQTGAWLSFEQQTSSSQEKDAGDHIDKSYLVLLQPHAKHISQDLLRASYLLETDICGLEKTLEVILSLLVWVIAWPNIINDPKISSWVNQFIQITSEAEITYEELRKTVQYMNTQHLGSSEYPINKEYLATMKQKILESCNITDQLKNIVNNAHQIFDSIETKISTEEQEKRYQKIKKEEITYLVLKSTELYHQAQLVNSSFNSYSQKILKMLKKNPL